MQLLQEPRERSPLKTSDLENIIHLSVEWASKQADKLRGLISSDTVYFAYSGLGIIPALIIANSLRTLTGTHRFDAMDAVYLTYTVLPYSRSDYTILYFMSSPWERNIAARLGETSRIMGIEAKFLVPDVRDPVIREKIPLENIIEVPGDKYSFLHESVLAFILALKSSENILGDSNPRIERLMKEASTFSDVIESLYDNYSGVVSSITKSSGELDVLYTPLMKPAAISLWMNLYERLEGRPHLIPMTLNYNLGEMQGKTIVMLYTSVEELMARETRFSILRRGGNIIDMPFKTDPLSAQLYGLFLSLLI